MAEGFTTPGRKHDNGHRGNSHVQITLKGTRVHRFGIEEQKPHAVGGYAGNGEGGEALRISSTSSDRRFYS